MYIINYVYNVMMFCTYHLSVERLDLFCNNVLYYFNFNIHLCNVDAFRKIENKLLDFVVSFFIAFVKLESEGCCLLLSSEEQCHKRITLLLRFLCGQRR